MYICIVSVFCIPESTKRAEDIRGEVHLGKSQSVPQGYTLLYLVMRFAN